MVRFQSTDTPELREYPKIPLIEFNSINKLAVAAILFGVSHCLRCNNGAKKIPPPIPTIPEIKPIIPA